MDVNLRVLKRYDNNALEIIAHAKHVIGYSFNKEQQSWHKLGYEGPLLIYKRSTQPEFGFVIINRIALEHCFGLITPTQKLLRSNSFLIYQESQTNQIIGIWFYQQDEQDKIAKLWDSLIQSFNEQN